MERNILRLRIGASLHFLIAIGHLACLFFLEEAFQAYGIWVVMPYSIRTIVGIYGLIGEFSYLQFFSTLVPAILVWCYLPGIKQF